MGFAARTAARTRDHRRNHRMRTIAHPTIHKPSRSSGRIADSIDWRAGAATGTVASVNGWLISSIIIVISGCATMAGALRQKLSTTPSMLVPTLTPSDTSSENGIRNLHDAASHSQYRARA
jgi:hypothetical protein